MRMSLEPNQLVPQDRPELDGYGVSRWNALRHGVLSRYTVLPWESEAEYHELLNALVQEHQPHGPTEEHLVEELAGILWRKRRLRLAEAASFRKGLAGTTSVLGNTAGAAVAHIRASATREEVGAAIRATSQDTARDFAGLEEAEARTRDAMAVLEAGRAEAYEQALMALQEDTRDWWQDVLRGEVEGDEPYTASPESLLRFLQGEVASWFI